MQYYFNNTIIRILIIFISQIQQLGAKKLKGVPREGFENAVLS